MDAAATRNPQPPAASSTEADPAPRRRNPRGQGDRLRRDLVAATIDLLARTGDPDEITLRAVAREAGVAPNSVYRHFDGCEAMVQAACDELFAEFQQELDDAAEGASDCFDELRRRGHGYVTYALAEHGHYRALFSSETPRPARSFDGSAGVDAFQRLVDLVQRCIDAGADPGADATTVAFELFTALHGIVDLRITHAFMPWPPIEVLLERLQVRLGLVAPAPDAHRG